MRWLADFYHVDAGNEPLSVLAEFGAEIAHLHLADSGRKNPGTGKYDYPTFLPNLKPSGYSGR
jgi:sugar phosphate isomerase/epimerase